MDIAKNIKRLRRERDLTQEQLAAIIGVTSQAVSKWERGGGIPDVSLLPSIAFALNTTLDILFGADDEQKRIAEAKLNSQMNLLRAEKQEAELAALLRDAIKRFPENWQYRLMLAEICDRSSEYGNIYDESATLESVAHYEYILKYCQDVTMKNKAVMSLTRIHINIQNISKAQEYSEMLVPSDYSRESVMPFLLDGEERDAFLQNEMVRSAERFWKMSRYLSESMSSGYVEMIRMFSKSDKLSFERKCEILELGIQAAQLIYGAGIGKGLASSNYYVLAVMCMENGLSEDALSHLEKAAELACSERNKSDVFAQSGDAVQLAAAWDLTPAQMLARLTPHMGMHPLAPLMDDERFKAIIEKLEAHI